MIHPKMLSTYPKLLRQQLWRKVAKLLRQDAFGCTAKKVGSALTLTRLSCLIPTRLRTRITTVCNRVVSSWRRRLSYVPTPLGCKARPSVSWVIELFWSIIFYQSLENSSKIQADISKEMDNF